VKKDWKRKERKKKMEKGDQKKYIYLQIHR
jgi:hypothetical protein